MKKELIEKFMVKILNYLESAEAFLGNHVPGFINEVLNYSFIQALIWFVVTLLIFSSILIALSKFKSLCKLHKESDYDEIPKEALTIAQSIIVIIGLIFLTSISIKMVKIKAAPRVFLLEYVKLIK